MEVQPREEPLRRSYEPVHEGQVLFPFHPAVAHPQIEGIFQQALPIGPGVQHHGQHLGGIDAGCRRIDHQLPGGDADPVGSPVSDAKDGFPVSDHHEPDPAAFRSVHQSLFQLVLPVDGKVHSILGRHEEITVVPDAFRNPRIVHNGHEFLHMLLE